MNQNKYVSISDSPYEEIMRLILNRIEILEARIDNLQKENETVIHQSEQEIERRTLRIKFGRKRDRRV